MGLRAKVGLLTAGFLVALLVVLFLVASRLMVRGFASVEVQSMRDSVQTFEGHMPFEYFEVSSRIRELAPVAELARFVRDPDPAFAEAYLGPERLQALNLGFVAFLDAQGTIVRWVDVHSALDPSAVEPGTFRTVVPDDPSQDAPAASGIRMQPSTLSGLLMVAGQPSIVAMTSLLRADGTDAAVAVGRVLDDRQVGLIEDLTHLQIDLVPWDESELAWDMAEARRRIEDGVRRPVIALDDDRIAGFARLRDLEEEPVLLARVVRPRTVFAQAQQSQRTLLASVAVVGIAFIGVMLLGLQRGVLRRITVLSDDLRRIASDRDRRLRVDVSGADEIGRIADDVNSMLEALAASEEALRESERRYALAAEGGNDGIWDWDVRSGEVYYSPRWFEISGLDPEEAASEPDTWLSLVHPDDRERVREALDEHLAGATPHFEAEHRVQRPDGSFRWVLARGKAIFEDGEPVRVAGSLTDITDRGLFDPLTGLPNRHLLEQRIEHVLVKGRSDRHAGAAMLAVRLEHLEAVRESLGQEAVDHVSLEIARRLRAVLRDADTVARTAQDTYLVLLEDAYSPRTLPDVADRVTDTLGEPFEVLGREVMIDARLGLVGEIETYPGSSEAIRDVGIAANRAMEQRTPYVFFDESMADEIMHARELVLDLQGAAERGELCIELQPVVDIASEWPLWYEALVRWDHPEHGRLPPGSFIPLAEESGAIVSVGAWVLREAARQVATLRSAGHDVAVSVNLSAAQIFHPTLIDTVRTAISDAAIAPGVVQLEVTETALMQDAAAAAEVLEALRQVGVGIVMDDFGTGYSSLSYIHALPLDKIKIDRSFVARMNEDMTSLEIVRTIIGLARTLGLTVVAEGIERERQAALLTDLGCTVGQGYLFSVPKPLGAFLAEAG